MVSAAADADRKRGTYSLNNWFGEAEIELGNHCIFRECRLADRFQNNLFRSPRHLAAICWTCHP